MLKNSFLLTLFLFSIQPVSVDGSFQAPDFYTKKSFYHFPFMEEIISYFNFFMESDDIKIENAQALLEAFSVYRQDFSLVSRLGEQETALISNLKKLNISLDNISESFDDDLERVSFSLSSMRNSLWWRSLYFKRWYVDQNIAILENELYQSLLKVENLSSYFSKHSDFIYGHQLMNFYNAISQDSEDVESFALGFMIQSKYPLIDYVLKAKKDCRWIDQLSVTPSKLVAYPQMIVAIKQYKKIILNSIKKIMASTSYKDEVAQKQHNEHQAALLVIQQAKAAAHSQRAEAARLQALAAIEENKIRQNYYNRSSESDSDRTD